MESSDPHVSYAKGGPGGIVTFGADKSVGILYVPPKLVRHDRASTSIVLTWPCARRSDTRPTPGRHPAVDVTPLSSLRENAIPKEPGVSYPERWWCVFWLGASMVAQAPSSLPRM